MPLDEPQPSAPRRADLEPDPPAAGRQAPTGAGDLSHRERAYLEVLLEGVPLPATKSDLIAHAKGEGSPDAVTALKRLPSRRYSSIDEVGEQLQPVQPQWPRTHRVPRPESDLPPGGDRYGVSRS